MKITLKLNGHSREYYADITARKCREAYRTKKALVEELSANEAVYNEAIMDEMVEFVVMAFDRQFTADEFLDGYNGTIFETVDIINAVLDGLTKALDEGFPKNANAPATKAK